MSHSRLNRSIGLISGLLVVVAIVIGGTATLRAFDCQASSYHCCWPPYPSEAHWGADAPYADSTDCSGGMGSSERWCIANSPYAYFTDCTY